MPDSVGYTPGTGANIAVDEISGLLHQRVKVGIGADGTAVDVSESNPMPMAAYGELIEAVEAMRMAVQSLTRTIGLVQVDTRGRIVMVPEQATAATLNATVAGSLSTVSTVTNAAQLGGIAANDLIPITSRLGGDNLRRNISVT